MLRTEFYIKTKYPLGIIDGNLIILESVDMEWSRRQYIKEVSDGFGYDIAVDDFKRFDYIFANVIAYRDLEYQCCKILWDNMFDDWQLGWYTEDIENYVLSYDPSNFIYSRFDILDL